MTLSATAKIIRAKRAHDLCLAASRRLIANPPPHGWRTALALHLGVRPATVRQWVLGVRPIPPRFLTLLEAA